MLVQKYLFSLEDKLHEGEKKSLISKHCGAYLGDHPMESM